MKTLVSLSSVPEKFDDRRLNMNHFYSPPRNRSNSFFAKNKKYFSEVIIRDERFILCGIIGDNSASTYATRFHSHAGGMAIARPYGFEIDFVRNLITGSTS